MSLIIIITIMIMMIYKIIIVIKRKIMVKRNKKNYKEVQKKAETRVEIKTGPNLWLKLSGS